MKTIPLVTAAALLLASTVPASAALSTGNLDLDVCSALGGAGSVSVRVDDDGVATLSGFARGAMARLAAERAAAAHPDVTGVENRIVVD